MVAKDARFKVRFLAHILLLLLYPFWKLPWKLLCLLSSVLLMAFCRLSGCTIGVRCRMYGFLTDWFFPGYSWIALMPSAISCTGLIWSQPMEDWCLGWDWVLQEIYDILVALSLPIICGLILKGLWLRPLNCWFDCLDWLCTFPWDCELSCMLPMIAGGCTCMLGTTLKGFGTLWVEPCDLID